MRANHIEEVNLTFVQPTGAVCSGNKAAKPDRGKVTPSVRKQRIGVLGLLIAAAG
jgi:hypothetical protein